MANSTFVEIQQRVYLDMRENTTSQTYPLDQTKTRINEIQQQICRGEFTSLIDPNIVYKAGDMRYIKEQLGITLNVSTTLTQALNVGDTTLYCNTSTLQTATVGDPKYVCIDEQVIEYTGQTSTSLTGIRGQVFDILVGQVVTQVYKIPGDYSKILGLQYVQSTVNVNMSFNPYFNRWVEYWDQRVNKPTFWFRTILPDSFTATNNYLFVNGYNSNSDRFILWYYRQAEDMVADEDECTLPMDFGVRVIAPIVAGEWLYATDEPDRGRELLLKGYTALQELYSYYDIPKKDFRTKVRPRPFDGSSFSGTQNRTWIVTDFQ